MIKPSLFFLYPQTFLWEQTINFALKNIAEQYGFEYKPTIYNHNGYTNILNDLETDTNCTLAFFENNPHFSSKDFELVKSKLPNAKIIMFGSDTIYDGIRSIVWPIDLLIDTMKCVVKEADKFPAEHFYWNISDTVIKEAKSKEFINRKQYDFISICRDASSERCQFFQRIKDSGKNLQWNLKIYNPPDVYSIMSKHWIALGHTTPVFCGKSRSMKGYRDWIAPFLGTVLIYDDYPDILDIGENIVPTYKYLDANNVIELYKKITLSFKLYWGYLNKQMKWATENSLEKQLSKILIKYGWL